MSAILVTIPGNLSSDGLQVAVTFEGEDVTDVLVRPAYSTQAWETLGSVGGTFEVRS